MVRHRVCPRSSTFGKLVRRETPRYIQELGTQLTLSFQRTVQRVTRPVPIHEELGGRLTTSFKAAVARTTDPTTISSLVSAFELTPFVGSIAFRDRLYDILTGLGGGPISARWLRMSWICQIS